MRNSLLSDIQKLGGVPGHDNEAWKYTNLDFLSQQDYPSAERVGSKSPEPASPYLIEGAHIIRVRNGFVENPDSKLPKESGIEIKGIGGSQVSGASQDTPFVARLGAARFQDGISIRVEKNFRAVSPVQILHTSRGDTPFSESYESMIRVEAGAALTVVEVFSGTGGYFRNSLERIQVDSGAQLNYYRIELDAPESRHLGRTEIEIGSGAEVNCWNFAMGAALVRSELRARYNGEGIQGHFYGLSLGDETQRIDHQTEILHEAPRSLSRQNFKGVLGGKSRLIFNGRIFIGKGCDGTDSSQINKNLLLSRGAEVDTKPQLEVHADDVKATHGAAVGRMDPDQRFYLESRGLDPSETGAMLSQAFLDEIFMTVKDLQVRSLVREVFFARFHSLKWEEV